MHPSRSIQDLCCITQATVFNVCLSERDLRDLGVWREEQRGLSPHVWSRAALHKACRENVALARKVGDLFDVHYLDTVVLVRCMEVEELRRLLEMWVDDPQGEALPGLLWALCSDRRPVVHALGVRLGHEAINAACRRMVDVVGGGVGEAGSDSA